MSEQQLEDVARWCNRYPDINVAHQLAGRQAHGWRGSAGGMCRRCAAARRCRHPLCSPLPPCSAHLFCITTTTTICRRRQRAGGRASQPDGAAGARGRGRAAASGCAEVSVAGLRERESRGQWMRRGECGRVAGAGSAGAHRRAQGGSCRYGRQVGAAAHRRCFCWPAHPAAPHLTYPPHPRRPSPLFPCQVPWAQGRELVAGGGRHRRKWVAGYQARHAAGRQQGREGGVPCSTVYVAARPAAAACCRWHLLPPCYRCMPRPPPHRRMPCLPALPPCSARPRSGSTS